MFADHLRSAIEAAPRLTLPAITAELWRAFAEGHVSEADAEALSALIEARQALRSPDLVSAAGPINPNAPQDRARSPRTGRSGSRPRTDASMERRRRWAASGRMPPAIAARFTLAEQSVLSLVAAETCRRKDCRLSVGGMAAIAGVSETTVRNAIREAVKLGLVTVEERRLTGWRSDTNIVRIISPEWTSWLRLTRKRKDEALTILSEGGGCKTANPTPTSLQDRGKLRPAEPSQGLPRGSGRPDRWRAERNRAGR
ncbi:hypothetical protein MEX01_51790 [Methylorubrum extorquens]|uniref:helix-turn-helix domain-containing protein n=1 Tax=Methylorubrum extorquens TaxID=408 RepID=UPI00116D4BDF|nr:helix-turn-helix domain-containing protein [Methylorubrum extorquens]GEL44588.1 hypothetical protein MEX01_51790 [Methylorubrum extorquens]